MLESSVFRKTESGYWFHKSTKFHRKNLVLCNPRKILLVEFYVLVLNQKNCRIFFLLEDVFTAQLNCFSKVIKQVVFELASKRPG